MVHGTWSPSCSATAPPIVSLSKVSLTTLGWAPTPAESCPPSPLQRSPEHHLTCLLTSHCGVFSSVLHKRLWASMFQFHCHGLQTAVILAHFMMGANECALFFYCTVWRHYVCLVCFLEVFCVFFLLSFLSWNCSLRFLYLTVLTPKYYC